MTLHCLPAMHGLCPRAVSPGPQTGADPGPAASAGPAQRVTAGLWPALLNPRLLEEAADEGGVRARTPPKGQPPPTRHVAAAQGSSPSGPRSLTPGTRSRWKPGWVPATRCRGDLWGPSTCESNYRLEGGTRARGAHRAETPRNEKPGVRARAGFGGARRQGPVSCRTGLSP